MIPEFRNAYLFTGINGVGKTTLLKDICKKEPRSFYLFRGSSELMRKLDLEARDYDSLRRLPEDFKIKAFNDLMLEVLSQKNLSSKNTLLIDAHLYNYKQGKMVKSPIDWMNNLDKIFLVTATVDSVYSRISKDQKSRDIFPPEMKKDGRINMLKFFLNSTEEKARKVARQYSIPFYLVNNLDNKLTNTVQDFLQTHGQSSLEK